MSESMTIVGLADYQALQRGKNDTAALAVNGRCQGSGKLFFHASSPGKGGKAVSSHWRIAGTARNGRWSATVKGIPVGGPYEMQFRIGHDEVVTVGHILVGDLWVLAGQSNMEGVGDLDERIEKPHRLVNSYGMNETWENAVEPLHWLNESVDRCHNVSVPDKAARGIPEDRAWRQGRTKGAGLGLAFAKAMVRQTGVPIGLVPCGHGGTSMAQWDPALKAKGGGSLYGSMLRRVKVCGGQVAGVLWYQGESDANLTAEPKFIDNNIRFVQSMRKDFHNPDMPFLYVQIGPFVSGTEFPCWNNIQQRQLELESTLGHCGMVASIDLELDDLIHIGTHGLNRLGQRLGKVARPVVLGEKKILSGPRPRAAWVDAKAADQVFIRFSGVNGKLISDGKPFGFTLITPEGHIRPLPYRVKLTGDTVQLKFEAPVAVGSLVQYGRGLFPYCNIRDEADLALPAFGPARVFAKPDQPWETL